MSGENKPISRVFDWLKETIEKIRTLLIALGGLAAVAVPLYYTYLHPSGVPPPPTPGPADAHVPACYRLDVIPPATISISSVKSGNISKWFDLLFVNDCKVDLTIRVEFKPVTGGIVIAPPESWPGYTIRAGQKTTREVIPPNLEVLTEKPQVIQILVSIYNKENKKLIHEDTLKIQMVG